MDTNYNKSNIEGTKWQRACRVIIDNPFNQPPKITFIEEEIVNIGDNYINSIVDNCFIEFDSNNPLHTELYIKLNELYTILREERDSK